MGAENQQFDPELMKQMVDQLKPIVCGEVPDEIIELALKKNNLNLENAANMCLDPETVSEMQAELI